MKRLVVLFLGLIWVAGSYAGQKTVISGIVREAEHGTALANANVGLSPSSLGTATGSDGWFHLSSIQPGSYRLTVSYMGYHPVQMTIQVGDQDSLKLEINLETKLIDRQDVIVSASRYQSRQDETPLPIAVMTQDELRDLSPVTLADALQTEPGIALGRDGAWGTRISVRGLSRDKLVTLIDGYRIDTAEDIAAGLSMIDVDDISQVEVIQGGSSALYGTGAIGGVINIITQETYFSPEWFWKGSFSSHYQSVNQLGGANLSFSTGARHWFMRLNGSFRKAENTHTPAGELLNSQFEDHSYSVKAGIKPLQHHTLRFNIQRFKAEDVGIPGGGTVFPTDAEVRYPDEIRDLYSAEYIGDGWADILPKVTAKIFRQEIHRHVENIPHTIKLMPASGNTPAKRVSVLSIVAKADHTIDGFQLQSDWNLVPGQLLIAGVDWWRKEYLGDRVKNQKIEVLNADQSVKSTTYKTFGELPLPEAVYNSLGLYFQNEAKFLNDHLTLVMGGRYDWIDTENELALNPVYEMTNGTMNTVPTTLDTLWMPDDSRNHSWSGNLGLAWRINQAVLSLNLARSFRSPYLEERYQYIDLGSVLKLGNPDLEPEESRFVDLGVLWNHPTFSLSVHTFLNQLDNLVVEQPGTYEGRSALYKMNVGEARLMGVDGSIDWAGIDHLSFYSTFSFTHGEDTQADQPLPAIAPFNSRIGALYTFRPLGEFDFSCLIYAAQNRVAEGELTTQGYQVFSLRFNSKPWNLNRTNWRISMGVDNILDHEYRNHLATTRGVITSEPGRNFMVRLSTDF
ncbi:MAG: TonB-dependent receptor [Candidatus Delongbacteria bacterium]|nr:TonB-dependent receptor [Candidatus Delongbacteria bacterium]